MTVQIVEVISTARIDCVIYSAQSDLVILVLVVLDGPFTGLSLEHALYSNTNEWGELFVSAGLADAQESAPAIGLAELDGHVVHVAINCISRDTGHRLEVGRFVKPPSKKCKLQAPYRYRHQRIANGRYLKRGAFHTLKWR